MYTQLKKAKIRSKNLINCLMFLRNVIVKHYMIYFLYQLNAFVKCQ